MSETGARTTDSEGAGGTLEVWPNPPFDASSISIAEGARKIDPDFQWNHDFSPFASTEEDPEFSLGSTLPKPLV